MFRRACTASLTLARAGPYRQHSARRVRPRWDSRWEVRAFHNTASFREDSEHVTEYQDIIDNFSSSIKFPPATHHIKDLATAEASAAGKVTLHGYLNNQRNASSKLLFVELTSPDGLHSVQLKLFSSSPEGVALRDTLKLVRPYAPVAITGVVESRTAGSTKSKIDDDAPIKLTNIEINIEHLQPLNDFPKDIIVAEGTVIPPEQRHLQLRTTKALREAIIFRSRACELIRSHLSSKHGFTDIETPLLFKSTPEGAHEFLVPTRNPGHAYALPQSPQQYKQILMASGIPRYVQIAKCFRDEDLRADRQPEFTQIDLEMAFAGEEQVMVMIEDLVKTMWTELIGVDLWQSPFPRMTYEEAMSTYGSDKPDTRLGAPISRIDYMIPIDLIRKITSILDPAVDVFKLSISDDPEITRSFVNTFMSSPNARPFNANPDGQPGIFIYDSRKPLGGLQPFGFEAVEHLETQLELEEGDLIVLQARPSAPFAGGATATGNLRLALHRAAVAANHLPKPMGWSFLWITDFPLFTPADAPEAPSSSSTPAAPAHQASLNVTPTEALTDHPVLESTHHPFTAPKPDSAHLLLSSPLDVKAAHYDLVLNGVELGGGSRRIHKADMQRLVLEKVLRLPPARVAEFEHLLGVLRAGCPPHAGMALGLDRVLMLMLGRESIRDVVAFPKGGGGWDGLVCAPSKVTKEAWERYHLAPVAEKDK